MSSKSKSSSNNNTNNKKQQPHNNNKSTIDDNIASCPSSDTSTSSLIYSLGDTVKLLPSMSIDEENDIVVVNKEEGKEEENEQDVGEDGDVVIGKAVLNVDKLLLGNGNNKENHNQ